jgi:hypothetical protein
MQLAPLLGSRVARTSMTPRVDAMNRLDGYRMGTVTYTACCWLSAAKDASRLLKFSMIVSRSVSPVSPVQNDDSPQGQKTPTIRVAASALPKNTYL